MEGNSGLNLTDTDLERYSRQIVLENIGFEGQEKIRGSFVTVVGVGGLGAPIAQQLAAMGVGRMRIVDRDVVELSNLHRQILYGQSDIGLPKAEVAVNKLRGLNPDVEFEALTTSINDDVADDVVRGSDLVLDGLDSIYARYALNRACLNQKIPYIFGSAIETIGSATSIIPENGTPCLECFQPDLRDEDLPKCGTEGVHPSVLTVIASVEVSEAIRLLIGRPAILAGNLFYADISDLTFDKIKIAKQDGCRACGSEADAPRKYIPRKLVEDICGRENGKSVHVITPKENLNLSLDDLEVLVKNKGQSIRRRGEFGLTFDYNDKIGVSVVSSGVAIIVGAFTETKALEIYDNLVIKGLNIALERIDPNFIQVLASTGN